MIRLSLLSAILMLFQMCGAEPEVDVTLTSAAPSPRLGGSVVRAGSHYVELVAASDGRLEAVVLGAEGREPPSADVALSARVRVDAGEPEVVSLVWEPAHARYVGVLTAPPAPGASVDLDLRVGGTIARAKVPEVVVVVVPGPLVGAAPRARVEVERVPTRVARVSEPTVVVQAPAPRVVVSAPRPRIIVEDPRPTIVVRAPEPRVVVEARRPRADVIVVGPSVPSVVVVGPGHPHVRVEHREEHHRHHGRHRGRGHRRGHHDDD